MMAKRDIPNHPWRISGIAGMLFVTISLIAYGINELPPAFNQDKEIIARWFAENGKSYSYGHFIAGMAFLLFYFPFYAGFCERLRAAEGIPAIWTRVTWAGAIMSPAAGTMAGSFIMAAALLEGRATADAVQFAIAANFYAFTVSGAFAGTAMLGAAIIILRTHVFSRWLGWVGLFIGIAAIGSIVALVEGDPKGIGSAINGFAWIGYFLWIVAVSIELVRKPKFDLKQQ